MEQPFNGNIHRKSVTDEILEVASAAIQRLKRFAEDVSEEERSESDTLELELESTKLCLSKQTSNSDIEADSER